MNFRNSRIESNDQTGINGEVGGLQSNFPLAPQPSIYSLTFGELQSTMGGLGKEFGSMNMDELVKSIWSSDEIQTKASASAGGKDGAGYFQKQGSLTLPRTLSQKTVDDVLKDITKEYALPRDEGVPGGAGGAGSDMLQKQQTFKEMTLEEFLVKAGVVREDTIFPGNQSNGGLFGGTTGLPQQLDRNTMFLGNQSNQIPTLSSISQMNGNGVQAIQRPHPQQHSFSKQSTEANGSQLPSPTISRLSHLGIRSGTADQGLNNSLLHGIGIVGFGGGSAKGSPANQLSSDGVGRNNRHISSVSPAPYAFNGSLRGRRSGGAAEKVAERRQRRMIKNRESAARSRARKQAYTTELEAEVAKLKEENQELQKKQAEIMESQKNQVAEVQWRPKKQCLRRTHTGPW